MMGRGKILKNEEKVEQRLHVVLVIRFSLLITAAVRGAPGSS